MHIVHDMRHASAVSRNGVPIDCILKAAGWSSKTKIFAKFYKRELIEDKDAFALSILNS